MADSKKEQKDKKVKKVQWIAHMRNGTRIPFKSNEVAFGDDISPGVDHFLLEHPNFIEQDIVTAYPTSWDAEELNPDLKPIEDTLFDELVPVNTIPMLERLTFLIRQNQVNSLSRDKCRRDPRIKRLMLMLVLQFYGLCQVDPMDEWTRLRAYFDQGRQEDGPNNS